MFNDVSRNANESNIDDTYLSSCAETPKEPEKEKPASKKKKKKQEHVLH